MACFSTLFHFLLLNELSNVRPPEERKVAWRAQPVPVRRLVPVLATEPACRPACVGSASAVFRPLELCQFLRLHQVPQDRGSGLERPGLSPPRCPPCARSCPRALPVPVCSEGPRMLQALGRLSGQDRTSVSWVTARLPVSPRLVRGDTALDPGASWGGGALSLGSCRVGPGCGVLRLSPQGATLQGWSIPKPEELLGTRFWGAGGWVFHCHAS